LFHYKYEKNLGLLDHLLTSLEIAQIDKRG